jgi:DNA-binding PadR family transcriptional regulator
VSVRLSLLALLDQGPCYGYQLRTELDWRTGGAGPVNVGQIYNTLDRLERDKLVRKTGENNYYEITSVGSAAVAAWFATAAAPAELAGKLALAVTLPGVDVAAIIRAQREAALPPPLQLQLPNGEDSPGTAEQLAAAVVRRAERIERDAQLQLLDEVELLLTTGISPRGLSADVPKRGRPAKSGV